MIPRQNPPDRIREQSEVQAAYEQVGKTPRHSVKSWYRDIFEFYQKNEC